MNNQQMIYVIIKAVLKLNLNCVFYKQGNKMKINLYFLGIFLVSLFFVGMLKITENVRDVLFLLGVISGVIATELVKYFIAKKMKNKKSN